MHEEVNRDSLDFTQRSPEDYIDLRYLRYFVTVAELGSFTKAAEILNTVQPSISRQIKRLEEIIGTTLFVRSSRDLALTPAGTVFLEEAKNLLWQARHAVLAAQDAANPSSGRVNVGVVSGTETLFFDLVLSQVRKVMPDTIIAISSKMEGSMCGRLHDGSLDVAFMCGPIPRPEIRSLPVASMPLFVAIAESHPLAACEAIAVDDLRRFTMVLPDLESVPIFGNAVKQIAEREGITYDPGDTFCDSPLAALHVLMDTSFFSFMLECQGEFAPPGIVLRPVEAETRLTVELHLVSLEQAPRPLTRHFLNAFAEA